MVGFASPSRGERRGFKASDISVADFYTNYLGVEVRIL